MERGVKTPQPFWTIPESYKGKPVFIIGGGPSLQKVDLSLLLDQNVIGCNNAWQLGLPQYNFFYDHSFYVQNCRKLDEFDGTWITSAEKVNDPRVKKIRILNRPGWQSEERDAICFVKNSGAAAISIAATMGAKEIILLGFDLKAVDGQNNWHPSKSRPNYSKFIRHIEEVIRDIERLTDTRVYNATEGSAMTSAKFVDFRDFLAKSVA